MKNPDLCERSHCREPWTVSIIAERRHRRWTVRVCEVHALAYKNVDSDVAAGVVRLLAREAR